METYIGTKIINAISMTRGKWCGYRGWALPADEDGADEGYLVEYTDGGKANHPDFKGYISWSPKAQFEAAYRETVGLPFGLAIEALKLGKRVARAGWNGKGMWLSLSGPSPYRSITADAFWSKNNADYARSTIDGCANVLPCITMKTATGEILMGWTPNGIDMLADDWVILE